jgi:tetratricopeptide (TPR) repeat protein
MRNARRLKYPLVLSLLLLVACGIFGKKKKKQSPINSEAQNEIYYQAEAAFTAGNYAEAETLFQKFAEQSPHPASGFYRLACLKKAQKKWDEALEYTRRASAADTGTPYFYDLLNAEIFREQREYIKAGAIYQSWAMHLPGRWSLYQDAARMYQYAGNGAKLVQLCNAWSNAFGLREEIANAQVWAYSRAGKKDSVVWVYNHLVKKYPERRQYLVAYAGALLDAGKSAEAMLVYRDLLLTDPENGEILKSLCHYYKTANDIKAIWQIAPQIANSPQLDPQAKINCLEPLLVQSESNLYYDSLFPVLSTISKKDSANALVWFVLANWNFEHSDYLQAVHQFKRGLQINTTFNDFRKYTLSLGRLHYYGIMQKAADSMLEIFPSNPQVYNLMAIAFWGLKNNADAKKNCETGLSYAIDEEIKQQLLVTKAYILLQSNESKAAIALLEPIIRDKYRPEKINTEAWLALCEISVAAKVNLEKSANDCDSIFHLSVNLKESRRERAAQSLLIRAKALAALNEPAQAANLLIPAFKLNPNYAELYVFKAELLAKQGNISEAKKYYKQAWELAPGCDDWRIKSMQ